MSHLTFFVSEDSPESIITVELISEESFSDHFSVLTKAQQAWVALSEFKGKPGQYCLLPDPNGSVGKAWLAFDPDDLPALAGLSKRLPKGAYVFSDRSLLADQEWSSLYFMMAEAHYSYCFKDASKEKVSTHQWQAFDGLDMTRLNHEIAASCLGRDLINTPANHMQPSELASVAELLAKEYGATYRCVIGDDLLDVGFMGTHTVGAAGEQAPRMIDFSWGNPDHPSITLVGKGVCFDTGGLSLKTSRGMETMKKDMGGAAHVLALAKLIMSQELPILLRVLIPAVENGIGKGAYRLGDVIEYADGTVVEVMNTDAEGRLVVADALIEAGANGLPDLLIDFTTLTGAARVAVGLDIGAYFSNEKDIVSSLFSISEELHDPLWPLPLFRPYKKAFDSKVADLTNSAADGYGGATKAALFLEHFVPEGCPWLHFDVSGWVTASPRGLEKGAAVLGLRSAYRFLEKKVSA